jgi:hypothetical protein
MRIAYVTTDEVNLVLAVKLAGRWGATVSLVRPGDLAATAHYDAVIHDLDVVPRQQRNTLLEELGDGTPDRPTAVHGYGITDEQAKLLGRNSIAVAPRLRSGLLRSLCQAARPSRAIVPPDDALTTLTWINLAE